MVKYYLKLQLTLFSRTIQAFGLAPFLGFILIPFLFIISSLLLFIKLPFCEYIYPCIAIGVMMQNEHKSKDRFLKFNCTSADYRIIRLCEHLLIAIPFSAFLLFELHVLPAALLIGAAIMLSQFKINLPFHNTLPTPFSRIPFEFIIGFRRTFLIILGIYFVLFMAIQVDNFNLGLFALSVVYLIGLSYYGFIEPGFYVAIFKDNPQTFLIRKLKTGLLHASVSAFPIALILVIMYPQHYLFVGLVILIGSLLLLITILSKYSSYPDSMSVGDAILLAVSIVMPPLLIYTLPKLYKKSIQQLKPLLP